MTAPPTLDPLLAEAAGTPLPSDPTPSGTYCEAGYTEDHEGILYEATVRGHVFVLCLDCAIRHHAEEIQ